jgi:DUF2924 family protein
MIRLSAEVARSTLAALSDLDRGALVERWSEFYGHLAPRHAQVALLKGAIAWECQRILQPHTGGFMRTLREVHRSGAASAVKRLSPGTRLLREWQGETHQVSIVAAGFEYNGTIYKSLSAIARRITGTPWSGPQFFGLRR